MARQRRRYCRSQSRHQRRPIRRSTSRHGGGERRTHQRWGRSWLLCRVREGPHQESTLTPLRLTLPLPWYCRRGQRRDKEGGRASAGVEEEEVSLPCRSARMMRGKQGGGSVGVKLASPFPAPVPPTYYSHSIEIESEGESDTLRISHLRRGLPERRTGWRRESTLPPHSMYDANPLLVLSARCAGRQERGRTSVEGLAQNFLPVADPPADNSLAVEDRMQGKKVPPQRRDLTPHPHGRHPGA